MHRSHLYDFDERHVLVLLGKQSHALSAAEKIQAHLQIAPLGG